MELEEFLEHVNAGKPIKAASEYMLFCAETTQESMKIMMDLNSRYHTPKEIQELFAKMTGQPVETSLAVLRRSSRISMTTCCSEKTGTIWTST